MNHFRIYSVSYRVTKNCTIAANETYHFQDKQEALKKYKELQNNDLVEKGIESVEYDADFFPLFVTELRFYTAEFKDYDQVNNIPEAKEEPKKKKSKN